MIWERIKFLLRRANGIAPAYNRKTGDGLVVVGYDWYTDKVKVRRSHYGVFSPYDQGGYEMSREYYLALEESYNA